MNNTFSLQSLLDLAKSHTNTAVRNLGRSFTREQAEAQKLQMLADYRLDYLANFQKSLQQGISPVSWGNYQEFMNKLDLAVKQQSEVVAHWQRLAAVSRQELEAQQRRLMSYDILSQRHHKVVSRREGLREQKEHDEYAATAHARLANGE
ncbi:Flagellar protein fliJ [Georgfuchsia toluolica]|uniref:Flagellar FliJ protein n=1 Tax=Georgfuchsia toluolica TaxID=424218 RepID=A0A916J1P7_9PROT|nr:flagellar export protein FliJ [Georgfuchsia toluolica]CAG4882196.1 Flagellar protein fliJ [Georgfuchsia toluolica]